MSYLEGPINKCSSNSSWEDQYGTTISGNLAHFKPEITDRIGNTWHPCPYSTQADDGRSIALLGSLPSKNSHIDNNGRLYYMVPSYRGSWGYTCTFSGCPYSISHNGVGYFKR